MHRPNPGHASGFLIWAEKPGWIMLRKIHDSVITFSLAATPAEMEEFFGSLPPELARALNGISAWQWSDVRAVTNMVN